MLILMRPKIFWFYSVIYIIVRANCTFYQLDCHSCHFAIDFIENRFDKIWKRINTCVVWDKKYIIFSYLKNHTCLESTTHFSARVADSHVPKSIHNSHVRFFYRFFQIRLRTIPGAMWYYCAGPVQSDKSVVYQV